ncbi:helix-turn-helix domain-containing protein [Rhodococcoides yunnanense]|jgi:transcriptional regulator with XRE-family HTH domain|uniref:helix-turn-helix domain-containing protein n=1 Tax=Rhodococcoides yunnanense TaxID=278209 RepID=UPI0022B20534|nr:helix-turn-helix transcriptional regulator [Rhodococcus yunnanensis]MCZ4278602.1 helix-turn-helix transcriptional regulator [Rhodococcus yunnanensis]
MTANDNPDPLDGPAVTDARFAINMQRERERAGLSQADLVRNLREGNWQTVHQTTVSRIEKGERPVRLGEAMSIARALRVDLRHLLLEPDDAKVMASLDSAVKGLDGSYVAIVNRTDVWHSLRDSVENLLTTARASGHAEDEYPLPQAVSALRRTPSDAIAEGREQYEHEKQSEA